MADSFSMQPNPYFVISTLTNRPFRKTGCPKLFGMRFWLAFYQLLLRTFGGLLIKICHYVLISIQFKYEFTLDQFWEQEMAETSMDVSLVIFAWILSSKMSRKNTTSYLDSNSPQKTIFGWQFHLDSMISKYVHSII